MYTRLAYVGHVPHDTYRAAQIARDQSFGAAAAPTDYSYSPRTMRLDGDKPAADGSATWIYVGIGLGVVAVGGLAYYLTTHKKKGRRR